MFGNGLHDALLRPVWKSKFYDTYAIDATPARWRGDAGSSPLDGASTAAHPIHWLISTQGLAEAARRAGHERRPSFNILRRVEGRRVAGHGCAVSLFTASAE